ncbi:MAG: hypothetical protein HYU58_16300 [Proteobacteria bacterium]|nr:hypothetical protein [Pseudomonadota bacterium]
MAEIAVREQGRSLHRRPPKVAIVQKDARNTQVWLEPAMSVFGKDENASTVAMARLANGLGLVSGDASLELLNQIIVATSGKAGASEDKVNASLAFIAELKPRDPIEAMLAVQMVGTNFLIGRFQERLCTGVETIPQLDANGGFLIKLLRTFAAQTEAWRRYRTGGEQRVSVTHQHVTVNAEQAAIAVGARGGQGAAKKIDEQPHAPHSQQSA